MKLESHIAWRYLFSKKSHNAINIVSGVSALAVGVVTAAMVCVMSIMNGFGDIIEQMFSEFDPELRITAAEGKYFDCNTAAFDSVRTLPCVAVYTRTIEETALVEHEQKQIVARLKGVDSLYQRLTHIDSIITDGYYCVYDGAFERAVLGQGLAGQLSIGAHFIRGIKLYAPKREQTVNLLRPDDSFNTGSCFIAGIFAVNQVKYDNALMLVSLPLAQQLFDYTDSQATAIELKLTDWASVKAAKKTIRQILGPHFEVADRYEQQADFFRILRIEKLLTALLLVFILLIAAFNIIGSLTMLVLDKRDNITTLRNMGADNRQIRLIFLLEGWFISALGALFGLAAGITLCGLQQHFGWLKLGSGTEYILSSYPVSIQWTDILLVGVVVLAIGFLAAWIPTKPLTTETKP